MKYIVSTIIAFSFFFLALPMGAQNFSFSGILSVSKQQQPEASVELVANSESVPAGTSFFVVVKFQMAAGWHVYWKNPGEAGKALSITWENVPSGVSFGEWEWGAPKVYNQSGVINYVYEKEAFIKIPVVLSKDVPAGPLKIGGSADWIVCDDNGCYPRDAKVSFGINVVQSAGERILANQDVFATAEKTFPQKNTVGEFSFVRGDGGFSLRLTPSGLAGTDFSGAEFFPDSEVFNAGKTILGAEKKNDGTLVFPLELNEDENFNEKTLTGVLRLKDGRTFSVIAKEAYAPAQTAQVRENSSAASPSAATASEWIPWTRQKQEELLDSGKIVYVDFTARWCATCQVNKRVYHDESLMKKLSDAGVVLMRADWTKKNAEIWNELREYGREAVPFNVFLKKDQKPFVLSEAFAGSSTVSDALDEVLAGRGSSDEKPEQSPMLMLVLLAVLGGLILNLMPCVFPVLGLKIMHFVGQAGNDGNKIARHGIVFGIGVLVSFWILAGILMVLRSGGAQLGWGFQLQSPVFVFVMILIMLVFGLSMSGVFEFGVSAVSAGGSLTQKSGYAGSFFSGVLAVIIATPCAAPFLAPALGAALALDPLSSFVLFTCIALGLAAPYVLLSMFPRALKFLPKPGEWMESFKQGMAFLLYAPAAYFVWVLMGQVDDAIVQRNLLMSLAAIAMSCWIYGRWGAAWRPARTRIIAKVVAFAVFAGTCLYAYTVLV